MQWSHKCACNLGVDRQVLIAALIEIERRRADLNADGILCQDEINQIAQSLAPWELRGGLGSPSNDRDGQQQDSDVDSIQEHQRIPVHQEERQGPRHKHRQGEGQANSHRANAVREGLSEPGTDKHGPQQQGHMGRGGGINELLDFRFKPEVDLTVGPDLFAYDRVYACMCAYTHILHARMCACTHIHRWT